MRNWRRLVMVLAVGAVTGACGTAEGVQAEPDPPGATTDVAVVIAGELSTTATGIEFIRTPEARFEDLAGYAFEPNYLDIDGLRIQYVDEGPADGPVVFLLHGNPTWSYMYRETIAGLATAGYRVVAPDLPGFGRSDKPTNPDIYTYQGMVDWTLDIVAGLDIQAATLVVHDWGGLIGLRVLASDPDRFDRVVAMNTVLWSFPDMPDPATASPADIEANPVLTLLQAFNAGNLAPQEMVQAGTTATLSEDVLDGYAAPFPDERYLTGPRTLPLRLFTDAEANEAAWEVLRGFERPFLTIWAPDDPVFGFGQSALVDQIPGAAGQPHRVVPDVSHFVPEEGSSEVLPSILEFLAEARA